MRKKQQIHRYAQFTLVELLVVIAILLILISLLQPHLRSVIGKGRQIACNKTEQSFGLANAIYANDYNGICIPAWHYAPGSDRAVESNRTAWFENKVLQELMKVSTGSSDYHWEKKWSCPDSYALNNTDPNSKTYAASDTNFEYPQIQFSYGFNCTRLGLLSSDSDPNGYRWGNKGLQGEDVFYSLQKLTSPSQTMFMGESIRSPNLYRSSIAYWSKYLGDGIQPKGDGNTAFMAYPHNWKVNALFFDGSVRTLHADELENTATSSFWRPDLP